jgi:hypothetical protein
MAPSTLLKRLALAGCIGVTSLAASGCVSTVSTNVAIQGNSATITVALNLDGDASAVIARTPALVTELNQVLSNRIGSAQHVKVTPELVSWSDTITYTQLIANKDILGVGALSTTKSGSSVMVDVGLIDPTGLDTALAAGAKGQPNSAALLITMEHYTTLSVSISFPGTAKIISSTGPTPVVSGNVATVTQNLFAYHPGAFVVVGSLSSSTPWLYFILGALVVAIIIVVLGRRRPSRN